jgi:hypothetical protein
MSNKHILFGLLLATAPLSACGLNHQRPDTGNERPAHLKLDPDAASRFAQIALKGIQREYPNKLGHVMNSAEEVKNPSALHPAFYGSFDWHSSVHSHWMLVRLLKRFPKLPEAEQIRQVLGRHLSAENIATEVAYLHAPNRKSFERTYGWAWLLKLAAELQDWDDPDSRAWARNLAPLASALTERYLDFLPRQTYPIRRGVHPNTAFGIAFALDYARAVDHHDLEKLLVQRSLDYFGQDRDYPAQWEPDGDDFFSRSLMEADLMWRVLPAREYAQWLQAFLPGLKYGKPQSLLEPAQVSDRSDPKIVHLDGLNLSRAWCMNGIARALPSHDPRIDILLASAQHHAQATGPHIASGHYEGEHWLASFAVYLLTGAGESL